MEQEKPGRHESESAPTAAQGLHAFTATLRETDPDLAAALESLARGVGRGSPDDVPAAMRDLRRRHADAFAAGALAGFAVALLARAGETGHPPGKAGVVSSPDAAAQTGGGGLGQLESPEPGDETP